MVDLPGNTAQRNNGKYCLSCSSCPSCCRTVRVPITHRDLQRLRGATALPMRSYIEWLSPQEIDMTGEPESFVEARVGRRLLVLRHEQGGCSFLSPEGRCAVYLARPSACAAYPFALENVELESSPLERLPDSACAFPESAASELCRVSAKRVYAELRRYVKLVEIWNRRQKRRRMLRKPPETTEEFLKFASDRKVRDTSG